MGTAVIIVVALVVLVVIAFAWWTAAQGRKDRDARDKSVTEAAAAQKVADTATREAEQAKADLIARSAELTATSNRVKELETQIERTAPPAARLLENGRPS